MRQFVGITRLQRGPKWQVECGDTFINANGGSLPSLQDRPPQRPGPQFNVPTPETVTSQVFYTYGTVGIYTVTSYKSLWLGVEQTNSPIIAHVLSKFRCGSRYHTFTRADQEISMRCDVTES